jgi:hypothetical protein
VVYAYDAKGKIKEDKHAQAGQGDQAADAWYEHLYRHRLSFIVQDGLLRFVCREMAD